MRNLGHVLEEAVGWDCRGSGPADPWGSQGSVLRRMN